VRKVRHPYAERMWLQNLQFSQGEFEGLECFTDGGVRGIYSVAFSMYAARLLVRVRYEV
jgi:hypothetical protein